MNTSKRELTGSGIAFDYPLFFMYLILVGVGWITIYAAGYNEEHPGILNLDYNYGKQALWILLALLSGGLIMLLDAKFFNAFSYWFYGLLLFLLILVLFIGSVTAGSKSWFLIGGFKLQPAEFAKFTTALALARYLDTYGVSLKKIRPRFISALIVLVPMLLVLLQNDTGSALVFSSFILVFFREGLSPWILAVGFYLGTLLILSLLYPIAYIMAGVGLLGLIFIIFLRKSRTALLLIMAVIIGSGLLVQSVDVVMNKIMQPHQTQRINVFLGKVEDLKGAGYNVHQSKVAIGSGGLYGKGFLKGYQTKMQFVPENETDFIFCTLGEEFGFIGSAGLIALFVLFLGRIIMIAERQRTKFSRIYAYSVASILFFHFLINISMTIGLFPVVGIPLPFISYGGSSMLGFSILIFVLLRLDASRIYEMKRAFDE